MRTFEEIREDIQRARNRSDVDLIRALANELLALNTQPAEAYALNALGVSEELTSNYPSALEYYRRTLILLEMLGDRNGVAGITVNVGNVHRKTGDFSSALEHYRRALAVHEELGDRRGVATIIGNIGNVLTNVGDYAAALEYYRRALLLHEALGDSAGVARATMGMGNVYYTTDDYPAALDHHRRALALFQVLGDRIGMAHATSAMGSVHYSTHDYPEALDHYRRALVLYDDQNDRAGVASINDNMGNVFFEMGNHSEALEHYRQALRMHEEQGNRAGTARVTGSIITTLLKIDRYDEAADLLERQASMQMDNPSVRAHHQSDRGILALHREDLYAAHYHFKEALAIATEAGLRAESASFHEDLRDLALKRNDFAGYIEHNNENLRITEEIRGKATTQRMAMMEAERRVQEERLKNERERALLYGALPKSIADRMIRGDDVSGDHFDNAAVMFIDIVGFTTNTSHMPPTDVVKLLENIFSTLDGICDHHNVVKVKTIGDSYMCFRGDADATTNALSIAAVALHVTKGAFSWSNGDPLQFRLGIHIGPATAGVIGTQRLQYDVWGDTVNVASRMESTSEPGRIHVSEALAAVLNAHKNSPPDPLSHASLERGTYTVVPRGIVEVKGKGTMQTYWLEPGRQYEQH